jgi:flagellar hook assembly protein FlgD
MAESGYAVLTVYNALGQEVKTLSSSYLSGGNYTVSWDATNDLGQHVPSGVYLYTLSANGSSVSKKMVLMK